MKTSVLTNQNELFNRYVTPYFRFIYWLCAKYTISRFYIEDIYQDVLSEIFMVIHTFDEERGSVLTWLSVVVSRKVWKLNKKYSSKENTDDFYQFRLDAAMCQIDGDVDDVYSDDISWALNELTFIEREALLLHIAGYSHHEIAEISYSSNNIAVISTDTIKSRLMQAKKHMQRLVNNNGRKRGG